MLGFLSFQCAGPEHLQHNLGATGTAGVSVTGVAGAGGTAAPAGAAGDGSISGTAGDTGAGVAGTTGAAGALTGTAGAGTAGAGTAGAGTAGAGTAGAGTAGAGTAGAGTAGAGTAGAGTAGAGTAGAGTAGAGTEGAGTGTAGAGTAGAGTAGAGPPVDGCNHVNWTFTPQLLCVNPPNASCGFDITQRGPQYAIDGDTVTRYTDGQTQVGGEFVTLAFGSTIKLSGVTLIANPAADGAKAYKAEYSTDGTTFVAFAPAVAGTGGLASLPINFPAATLMKALKITQTGATVAPATSWWSINEITLNGCIDQ